jgi:hypothetical protein
MSPQGPDLVAWRDPTLPPLELPQRALGARHRRDHGVIRFGQPAVLKPIYLVVSAAFTAPAPRFSRWRRFAATLARIAR